MASSLKTKHQKQVRGFVLIWSGITFIMAAVTFIAIYMTYGSLTPPGTNLRNVAIPSVTELVQVSTNTPTQEAAETAVATELALAQAAPTTAATATPRPIDVLRFQLGTQVQVSYDRMGEWMNVAANQLDVNWVKM